MTPGQRSGRGRRSPVRRAIFRLHSLFGIGIGLVLGLMGVTGAIMSFEDQIMTALSPAIVGVVPRDRPVLTPDQLVARFTRERPDARLTSLTLRSEPGASPRLSFDAVTDGKPRSDRLYVDPYTGDILGHAVGESFFATIRRLHRFLLLPQGANGYGRTITGIAAWSLVGFLATGIYLRWPRRPLSWRPWLKPYLKARGRGLYLTLHQVIGTWVLPIYLIIALTGLTYSYGWYRSGFDRLLSGQAKHRAPAPSPRMVPRSLVRLDPAWRAASRAAGPIRRLDMTVPTDPNGPVKLRYLPDTAAHEQAFDEMTVEPISGRILSRDRFAERSLGERIVLARLAVHRGTFFGPPFAILFMIAAAAMPLFPITGWLLYLKRR